MTQYCPTRWNLYTRWSQASAAYKVMPFDANYQDVIRFRQELERHHQSCPICLEHALEMTKQAQNANMPELEP